MFHRYMEQFYPNEGINMDILKKAAYTDDPKCHLYDCGVVREGAVDAGAAGEGEEDDGVTYRLKRQVKE